MTADETPHLKVGLVLILVFRVRGKYLLKKTVFPTAVAPFFSFFSPGKGFFERFVPLVASLHFKFKTPSHTDSWLLR